MRRQLRVWEGCDRDVVATDDRLVEMAFDEISVGGGLIDAYAEPQRSNHELLDISSRYTRDGARHCLVALNQCLNSCTNGSARPSYSRGSGT